MVVGGTSTGATSIATLLLLLAATLALSSAAPWPSAYQLGRHRALINLSATTTTIQPSSAPGSAVWVTIPWQRRRVPDTDSTDLVLTVASTGEVVKNAVRAPALGANSSREAITIVFQPATTNVAAARTTRTATTTDVEAAQQYVSHVTACRCCSCCPHCVFADTIPVASRCTAIVAFTLTHMISSLV